MAIIDVWSAAFRNRLLLYLGIAKLSTVSFFSVLQGVSLSAQTLEIELLNGRNGRPIAGETSYVNVWVGTERKESIVVSTDRRGIARLRLVSGAEEINIPSSHSDGSIVVNHPILRYAETFRINIPYVWCEPEVPNYSWLRTKTFSTEEILQHGYASPNTCGKVTASPKAGQIILFVRPLRWWEKLKQ